MKNLMLIAAMGLLLVSATAIGRFRMPTVVTTTCCKEVSNVMVKNTTGFKRQYAQPPCLKAIVFTTADKKQYCTDPHAPWVARRLRGGAVTSFCD
ncbi:eotaxin-like [Engraulis encrasicolus]|uniref:eotaxin-like n=1 Tax=Engraulis encrasicolus TaxID=184585 RepID=UPI002FD56B51